VEGLLFGEFANVLEALTSSDWHPWRVPRAGSPLNRSQISWTERFRRSTSDSRAWCLPSSK